MILIRKSRRRIKFIWTRRDGKARRWNVFSARQLCSFSLWEQPTHAACFIFLVYRNNCETRHPRGSHPTASTTRPFVKVCSLAKSQKRLLLAQRRYIAFSSKDQSSKKKKKGRRNVGPSLWNYVTVNWANTTGAPWPAGPELAFCLRHRALATWPEYRITSGQSNSYLNETSNEKKFPGCSKRHLKEREQYRSCCAHA